MFCGFCSHNLNTKNSAKFSLKSKAKYNEKTLCLLVNIRKPELISDLYTWWSPLPWQLRTGWTEQCHFCAALRELALRKNLFILGLIPYWYLCLSSAPDLTRGILQKDNQTSSTGHLCLLFLFSFPLAPHCKDLMQNLSLIKYRIEICICQMSWNLPMNCMIILLIEWIWWNMMNVM